MATLRPELRAALGWGLALAGALALMWVAASPEVPLEAKTRRLFRLVGVGLLAVSAWSLMDRLSQAWCAARWRVAESDDDTDKPSGPGPDSRPPSGDVVRTITERSPAKPVNPAQPIPLPDLCGTVAKAARLAAAVWLVMALVVPGAVSAGRAASWRFDFATLAVLAGPFWMAARLFGALMAAEQTRDRLNESGDPLPSPQAGRLVAAGYPWRDLWPAHLGAVVAGGGAALHLWNGAPGTLPDLAGLAIFVAGLAGGGITLEALRMVGEVTTATARTALQHARDEVRDAADRRSLQRRSGSRTDWKAERDRRRAARVAKERSAAAHRAGRHRDRLKTEIPFVGRGVSGGLSAKAPASDAGKLVAAGLPVLHTAAELAGFLGTDVRRLHWLTYHREVDTATHYVHFAVPKRRGGGERLLAAPKSAMRAAQRRVLDGILSKVPLHDAAHGFVPGRGTLTNASAHVGRGVVVNADLRDFFPSVTYPRVKGVFASLGYGERVATLLALLCTEAPRRRVTLPFAPPGLRCRPQAPATAPATASTSPSSGMPSLEKQDAASDRPASPAAASPAPSPASPQPSPAAAPEVPDLPRTHTADRAAEAAAALQPVTVWVAVGDRALPQGACTSPALSNLVARRLDERLARLAAKTGWTYTRYADDLTFSGEDPDGRTVGRVLSELRGIAAYKGFRLHDDKVRVQHAGRRQSVTGLTVNTKPSVSRAERRRLRAVLHEAERKGLDAANRKGLPAFGAHLRGWAAYVSMTDRAAGAKLLERVNRVAPANPPSPPSEPRPSA